MTDRAPRLAAFTNIKTNGPFLASSIATFVHFDPEMSPTLRHKTIVPNHVFVNGLADRKVEPPKEPRKGNIQLRICQIHAQTTSWSAREAQQAPLQFGTVRLFRPSLWSKIACVCKESLICVVYVSTGCYAGSSWNTLSAEHGTRVRDDTRDAARHTVPKAKCLFDHSAEIRDTFQCCPRRCCVPIGHCFLQFLLQSCLYLWIPQYMPGPVAEGVRGSVRACYKHEEGIVGQSTFTRRVLALAGIRVEHRIENSRC